MSEDIYEYRVIYHGRVQGVGFRYTTWALSQQFDVVGYVKNLADGTVELIAQCSDSTLQKFDGAIRQQFDGHLTDVDIQNRPRQEPYETFSIRR